MRKATQEDFKYGSAIFDSEGHEFRIKDKYEDGIYNVDVYSGTRLVGKKVVFVSEAKFYTVKAN